MGEKAFGRASLVGEAVIKLRNMIIDGELSPGQRLAESDLIEQLSISRGTLREMMRVLASEGLIDLTPHRSARVRRFEKGELHDLFEIRIVLESLAARLAARKVARDPDMGLPVTRLVEAMEAAARDGDLRRHVDLNREFHNQIVDLSGNEQLAVMLKHLQLQAFRALFTRKLTLGDTSDSNAEHRLLAGAIAIGDEEAAEKAMRAHIVRSGELIDRA